jgi:hypothetical protein
MEPEMVVLEVVLDLLYRLVEQEIRHQQVLLREIMVDHLEYFLMVVVEVGQVLQDNQLDLFLQIQLPAEEQVE